MTASHAEHNAYVRHSSFDSTTPDPAREKADHCSDLLRQADALKGKPQRRNMVLQQYELECKSR